LDGGVSKKVPGKLLATAAPRSPAIRWYSPRISDLTILLETIALPRECRPVSNDAGLFAKGTFPPMLYVFLFEDNRELGLDVRQRHMPQHLAFLQRNLANLGRPPSTHGFGSIGGLGVRLDSTSD
jgi:hypothetical protein